LQLNGFHIKGKDEPSGRVRASRFLIHKQIASTKTEKPPKAASPDL
jgi:hypothetical protein